MQTFSEPSDSVKYASFWQRTQAFLIDCLVFIPITILHNYSILYSKSFGIVLLASLAWMLYKPLLELKFGATIGKRIMKLKVVNYEGTLGDTNQIMLRFIPYFAIGISNLLLFYSMFQSPGFVEMHTIEELSKLQSENSSFSSSIATLFYIVSVSTIWYDPANQAWHDRFSNTYCIQVT